MLRRIAPKSLWGRTILIVVIPIFLMQSVVTFVFFVLRVWAIPRLSCCLMTWMRRHAISIARFGASISL